MKKVNALKMGKSTEPIIKVKLINVKEYSRKIEADYKLISEKKRKMEQKRRRSPFKMYKDPNQIRNRSNEGVQSISLQPFQNKETITFDFISKTEANVPEYTLDPHEYREIRERKEICKLIKQFFDVEFKDYHNNQKTPYPKKPVEISCFGQFSEDRSQIDFIEADYSHCYSTQLLTIKNLGRYDCWEDLPWEKWIEMCQKNDDEYDGTSPMYDHANDKFMWNPVKVLGFDPIKLRYNVIFVKTKKDVSRLSLLFRWENKAEFEYRKYLCEKRRTIVDQLILFTRYIDNVPKEIVSSLDLDWQKAIEFKVKYTTKRLIEKYNYIFDEKKPTFQREMAIANQDFIRQMKKCRILLEMQEKENEKKFKERSLDIRPFFQKVSIKKCAIVNHSPDFQKNLRLINTKSLFEDGPFIEKVVVEFLRGCEDLKKIQIILSDIDPALLPLELEDFKKVNSAFNTKSIYNLKNQCSNKFTALIRSFGHENRYNFLVSTKEDYDKSLAKRVVIYFNLILKNKTKELVDNSIIAFMQYFKLFSQCEYKASEFKLLEKEINTHYHESKLPLFKTKIIMKRVEIKDKKKANQSSVPKVKLIFTPSLNECKNGLIDSYTIIKKVISNEIKNLATLCFKLVDIEDKKIYTLEDDYPLYAEGLNKLTQIIDTCKEEGELKRKEFEVFLEILNNSAELYVKNNLGDKKETNKNLDVNKCQEILNHLNQLFAKLNTMESQIDLRLFRIITDDIKKTIEDKISEIMKLMIERMKDYCIARTEELEKESKEKIDLIKENPQDIDQYKAIYDILETILNFVKRKKEELTNVAEILRIIENQKFNSYEEVIILFKKLLKSWSIPNEITDSAKKSSDNMEMRKVEFSEELKKEQAEFKAKIMDLEKEFNTINKVDSFSEEINGQKGFSVIEEFKDQLTEWKANKEKIRKEMLILAPEKRKEIEEGSEDLPEFEKLETMVTDFQPYKILWEEDGNVMSEYDIKVNTKTLLELKELLPNNDRNSTKEVFIYVKDLEESRAKVEEVQKKNQYDSTLIKLVEQLRNKLDYYESFNWIVQCLNSACLKEDDWKEIRNLMGNDQTVDIKAKLIDLHAKGIENFRDQIERIKNLASKRAGFVQKYKDLNAKYNEIKLEEKDERKIGLKKIDEVLILLDEISNQLVNIISNPVTQSDPRLKNDSKALNEKIKNAQIILEEVIKFQSNYLYLEPIFNATEINKALANEKTEFMKVHTFWRNFMDNVEAIAWYLASYMDKENFNNLNKHFNDNNNLLQKIIRKLNEYLNIKRQEFPRFYFVSDEDLLRILAQSKNPLLVQPHLSKCFEGIHHVLFNDTNTIIQKMISSKDESVSLIKEINVNDDLCRGNVEVWLGLLEESMKNTMKDIAKNCLEDLNKKKRIDWIKDMEWPGQIVQIIDQIIWTSGAEVGINDNKLKEFLKQLDLELSQVVDLVRSTVPTLLSITLSGLIVISVHNRDIVEKLIKEDISKATDFEWKAQMRYYYHREEENADKRKKLEKICPIIVSMITTNLNYGFEYLGNFTRLVITPLTDRCFRTLFGAYNVKYGGAPEGPAGTGKTESVKDLSKCVGVMCNVFNCTEGIKTQGMSKFFKGLASSGCWCCFDEFNRIDTEVLSVIAQQILTIQNALKAKLNYFYFEENEKIVIKDTCAINITMNPSYSGRNELPDNLKALFRPCAMMVADYNLIAQIKLYSFGFQTAKPLSFKIVSSLKLSSEQLSTQSHYDFGMRSLNAILVAAGKEKKKNPDLEEDRIAFRALVDVNLPKFTTNDSPLFYQLVHDLFPTTKELESSLQLLEDQINQTCIDTNLQPNKNFIKKCIQLFETMNVRHALMIVGKPGTGKTKVIQTLKKSITLLKDKGPGYNKVDTLTLNPKSLQQKQLYGYFDMTQEWKKGLLQVKMTELVEKEKEVLKWLIFDGPVDTLWIENMNSLLDDNKKLCLEDSSSIFLADNMNIVFEVDDLKEASPATVSRNGMVLCETDTIALNDLIESYALSLPDHYFNEKLLNQFRDNAKWLIETIIHFLFKLEIEFGLPCSKFHLVESFLNSFDCYIRDYKNRDEVLPKGREITSKKLDNLLVASVLIGVMGPIKNQPKIQQFLYDLCGGKDVNTIYRLNINIEHLEETPDWKEKKLDVELDDYENIYNMVYLIETAQWYKWKDMPNKVEFTVNEEQKFNELVIPTPETIKMDWLISMVIPNKKHLLLTGSTGTGKTLTILNTLMSQYDTEFYSYIKMSMTAQTTAGFTQELIEKKLQKSYRKFSPVGGKKGIIFVDDLNMPQKEKYGAQPPIELLRQWMDYGGWYDLYGDGKDFINVIDISFLASMGSIATGRTVTPRYLRHFLIHYAENYSQETMNNIFSQVVQWFFIKTKQPTFSSKVIGFKDYLIKSTIAMYQEVSATFKATPAKTHYQFNLRDVSRVFLGISRTNARTVKDEQDMIKLWIHECERVFKDRLVNEEDRGMYDQIITKVMKTSMKRDAQALNENNLWGNYVPMIFVDGDPKKGVIEKQYCELSDAKLLKNTLVNKLHDYNRDIGNRSESGGPLNLVLFQYALNHLNRILRIISTYNGNAVLVGVGGSGRKSLTMLSAFIYNFVLIQYESDWIETLKSMMRELGNKEVVFVVSDSQIDDKQIEDLNNMLNNGEIPNLIDAQDLQVIRDNIPIEYTQGKKLQNDQETMTAFIENCKAKIHVALCLSPIGDGFRKRILMFPSLVSCTTIDWFLSWPEDALSSVADYYLSDMKEIDPNFYSHIINICVEMQSRVIDYSQRYYQELRRYNYVTPMSFIELLNLFKTLLKKRTVEINDEIQRYKNGLIVLAESEELSAKMEKDIKKLEPELTEQKEVTKKQVEALKDLKVELEKAEAEGRIAEEEAKGIAENASEQNAIANETLMKMQEKKKSAEDKLNSIDPNSVAEFKKYKFDEPVNRFCEFLCMLMLKNPHPKPKVGDNPKKPTTKNYFEYACKNILNKPPSDFLKDLKNFDSSKMAHEQMVELRTKIEENKDYSYFDPSKKSLAVNNLYQVIVDHNNIFFINVEYMPIKLKAEECAEKLRVAEEKLKDIQEKLDNTKKTKAVKEEELRKANELIANLEAKLHKCHVRLDNANILGNSLGSEKEEWKKRQESLETYAKNIIGDILVSCGVISYLGAFTKSYRELILQDWAKKVLETKIPLSVGENKSPNDIMRGILGDDMEIETWKTQKLPNDNFSTDNALIISKSRRFCLLIDPQNQALIWLKEKIRQEAEISKLSTDRRDKRKGDNRNEKRRKDGGTGDHYTIKPTMDNKTLVEVTIDCVQEGRSLIYENVGEVLNPLIAPIYKKEFYKSSGATYVNLNKQPYDVHENFRFFIITQLPKPHYLPEVCVSLTLVNFTVTEEGLEDQMLNFLVEKEDPALSQLRKECIDIKNLNERKKKEIERDILFQLDQSKKNATEDCTILDNEKLIEKLKQSNQTRITTLATLKKQAETEVKISIKRSFLRPVATHVSQLFFTVCDLSSIEPVYQYSLKFYQDIFGFAIDMTPKEKVDPKLQQDKEKNEGLRLEKLMKNFDEILYNKICMSLFEKDKLVFSFLLQTKLKMIPMTHEERSNYNKEIRFLVTGGSGKETQIPNPAKDDPQEWITQVTWNSLCELSESLDVFKELEKSMTSSLDKWKESILSQNPFDEKYPEPFNTLNDFHKMIVLRILRQDKTIPALKKYITDNMEEKYVVSPSFDIGKAYDESRNRTPILFIISPGADPLILIDKLCKREGKSLEDDVKTLSLGQGQEKAAIEAIDKAQERDQEKWILLQNCHLAKSFMNMLEKKVEEIQDTSSSFRMFLTALPSKVIPISIIQDSIKIVNEPPRGFKQSIQRTFGTIDEGSYDKCTKPIIFKRFVYGFCFFHSLILERRKYGPLGWNIPYEFSNSDLSISVAQLKNFLDDYDDVQYPALQYMVAEANYGGRVTDPSDRRLIAILFKDICTEDILDDRYCFGNLKDYSVPLDGSYQDHEDFINRTIPLNSVPGVFGLHDNADITCAKAETNSLFDTALLTLPRTVSAKAGTSTEDQVKERAEEIFKKLPNIFDVEAVRLKYTDAHLESLNSVLQQELMRYNNLLTIVKTSLKNLKDAIEGNAVMTPDIEIMVQSVYDNKTPEKIAKVSYPSVMSFSSWINDFLKKIDFLNKWIEEGIPPTFWISAFYFTHSFLTGILQNYARKYKIPIDELGFDFIVMSDIKEYDLTKKPEDGCYIYGFYSEGARWNSELRLLDDSLPKVLMPQIPHVWFKPAKKDENTKIVDYECPVYRTSKRSGELLTTGQSTNFLIHMYLPFDQQKYTSEHWVKRGTAVICSLNE